MAPSNSMKYAVLVGDGMGDLPIAGLAGKTPLEAAATPAMDFIAGHGELCLLRTVPAGYPPGSDVANLSLLGYLPERYYSGRAPLEAASMGISLCRNETAFRCNLVTVDFTGNGRLMMRDYSSGHISTAEAAVLIKGIDAVAGSDTCRFYPGISYRHLLVHQGELPGLVTVPPHDFTNRDVTEFWERYQKFPHLKSLLAKVRDFLGGHEINRERAARGQNQANCIWLWGEGKPPVMPTLAERYGISGALISAVDLLKGIGVYAGLEIINVPGATGYLDTNYEGKAAAALDVLREKDFVFVHVEAPDETGHQGDLPKKIQAIEEFDQRIVQPVLNGLRAMGTDFRLVIAMDHFTPIAIQTHSDQPVPVAVYDSRRTAPGSGKRYSEGNAAATGRLLANGEEFMKMILENP